MANTIREIIANLSKPVHYQWRVQSRTKDKKKAICTSFIDARDVQTILDKHCIWENVFTMKEGHVWCTIKIHAEDGVFSREDCGNRIEDNKTDQMYEQAVKSSASDAFKRAAVMFGIGRFLYGIDQITLPCDEFGNVVDGKGNRVWDLTKHINSMKGSPEPAGKAPVKKPEVAKVPVADPIANQIQAKPEENNKPAQAAKSVEGNEEPPIVTPSELPVLQPKQFDAMVKAITEGKIADVEAALPKYKLNLAQKTTLNKLIKDEKSKVNANQ